MSHSDIEPFLRYVDLKRDSVPGFDEYPFNIPAVKSLERLQFHPKVTEPESALSPKRQLSFLTRMHDLLATGSQFIIATHSPIIMAYPDSTIYKFSSDGISPIRYEETDHFQITQMFMTRREAMLRELLSEPENE